MGHNTHPNGFTSNHHIQMSDANTAGAHLAFQNLLVCVQLNVNMCVCMLASIQQHLGTPFSIRWVLQGLCTNLMCFKNIASIADKEDNHMLSKACLQKVCNIWLAPGIWQINRPHEEQWSSPRQLSLPLESSLFFCTHRPVVFSVDPLMFLQSSSSCSDSASLSVLMPHLTQHRTLSLIDFSLFVWPPGLSLTADLIQRCYPE